MSIRSIAVVAKRRAGVGGREWVGDDMLECVLHELSRDVDNCAHVDRLDRSLDRMPSCLAAFLVFFAILAKGLEVSPNGIFFILFVCGDLTIMFGLPQTHQ